MDHPTKTARNALALALALVTLTLAIPRDISAQWSLEGRVGSAIPIGDLTDDPLPQTAGLEFSGAVYYNFEVPWSLYGEVSAAMFNCDDCDTDADSWGFDAGGKYLFSQEGSALPWVRAGATIQRISLGDEAEEWGFGIDSGVGIDWLLNPQFSLVPALRYNWYEADDLAVSYFTIDLGAHWHPGG